jgi:two-component system, LytTR family, response regulator LytT
MNVLIVEDEAPAARRLQRLTASCLGAKLKTLECVESVEAARLALARTVFDLVLLDLDLGGADGFEIIRGVPNAPRVVVVSARVDRAIDAFDNAVVDFVTKPVSEERLARALEKALMPAPLRREQNLVVRSAGRIDLAPASEIVALSGADDYVEITLADGRRFLHDARLDDLEKRLPAGFVRVHRSHIVNAAHVRTIRTLQGGRRVLDVAGGAEIPISRRRITEVEKLIQAAGARSLVP